MEIKKFHLKSENLKIMLLFVQEKGKVLKIQQDFLLIPLKKIILLHFKKQFSHFFPSIFSCKLIQLNVNIQPVDNFTVPRGPKHHSGTERLIACRGPRGTRRSVPLFRPKTPNGRRHKFVPKNIKNI